MRRCVLLGLSVVLLWASVASATIYYASPGGSGSCTSAQGPSGRNTPTDINTGFGCLNPGDTLYLRAGTYGNGQYSPQLRGNDFTPSGVITVAGDPQDPPLSAVMKKPDSDNSTDYILQLVHSQFVIIQNITFNGLDSAGNRKNGTCINTNPNSGGFNDSHHIKILNCDIFGSQQSGIFSAADNAEVGFTTIHDLGNTTLDHGIYQIASNSEFHHLQIYGPGGTCVPLCKIQGYAIQNYSTSTPVANNSYHHNIFHDTRSPGLTIDAPGGGILFYNNIVYNSDTEGITIKQSSNNQIYNNTFWENGYNVNDPSHATSCIGNYGSGSGINIQNNICWQNHGDNIIGGGPTQSNTPNLLGTDPQFQSVTPGNVNFLKPSATSPANGSGVNLTSTFTNDLCGTPRPSSGNWDQGAYEFSATGCPSGGNAPVINTFQATANPINSGQSTFITWSSTNATTCTGTGFSTGAGSPPNSTGSGVSTGVLTSNTSYGLSCSGPGGTTTANFTLQVNVGLTVGTFYVAPPSSGGSDSVPCTGAGSAQNIGTPKQTIAGALSCAAGGSTIFLRAGTYNERITDAVPGGTSWTAKTLISGYQSEVATVQPSTGTTPTITFDLASNAFIEIANLTLPGGNALQRAVDIEGPAGPIRVRNCTISGTTLSSIISNNSANAEILGNFVSQTPSNGIYVDGTSTGTLIDRNTVFSFGNAGIMTDTTSSGTIISNNYIHDQSSAVAVGGLQINAASTAIAYNNVIANNFKGIVVTGTSANAQLLNNTIYNTLPIATPGVGLQVDATGPVTGLKVTNNIFATTGGITDGGSGTVFTTNLCSSAGTGCLASLVGPPGFASVTVTDQTYLHLASGSAAIGHGTNLTSTSIPANAPPLTKDKDGTARPASGAWDVGSYQFIGTTNVPPTVLITSPTSGSTYSTNTTPLSMGGTAAPTPPSTTAVTSVGWTNSRGGSGTATFTAPNWTITGIVLQSGSNVITVTATDTTNTTGSATLTVTLTGPATTYYVAPTGLDTNAGTSAAPFQHIQKCATVMVSGDSCLIRTGTYRETVTPTNNGVTFAPDTGATVTVSGADIVPGPWTSAGIAGTQIFKSSGMTWTMDTAPVSGVPNGVANNQVFVDGALMNLARWPNTTPNDPIHMTMAHSQSYTPLTCTGPGGACTTTPWVINDTNVPNINLTGAELIFYNTFCMTPGVVTSNVAGSSITFTNIALANDYRNDGICQGQCPYFVSNLLSLLDTGGEWFLDTGTTTLYLWTTTNDTPANHTVEAKRRNYAFDLSGKSNVSIHNINITAATINMNMSSSQNMLDTLTVTYPWYQSRPLPSPQAAGQFNVNNDSCMYGFESGVLLSGSNNTIQNSTVSLSSGAGIWLHGSNETATNNTIHDVGWIPGGVGGIGGHGDDFSDPGQVTNANPHISAPTVTFNTIYNIGDAGLFIGRADNQTITHNLVHDVCIWRNDCGITYTSHCSQSGSAVYAYNIFHDNKNAGAGMGIYLDQGCMNYTIHHNVVYNTPDYAFWATSGPVNVNVYNNTMQSTGDGVCMENPNGSVAINNLVTTSTENLCGAPSNVSNQLRSNNPPFATGTPLYQLASNATGAIDQGQIINGITDGFMGSAPDIGAYEFGVTPWTAGASIAAAPTATISVSPNPITSGSSSNITWGSTNATSCTSTNSNFSTGGAPSGGPLSTGTLTATTTYTITCTGAGGTTAPVSATVTVNPSGTTVGTFYVSPTGSDAVPCTGVGGATNIGSPKQTIASALACASGGSTIYLRTGTYNERIDSQAQAVPGGANWASRTLISQNPGDGTVTLAPTTGVTPIIRLDQAVNTFIEIYGVTLNAGTTSQRALMVQGPAGSIKLNNSVVTGGTLSAVYLFNSNNNQILSTTVSGGQSNGIYSDGTNTGNLIDHNIVTGVGGDGIRTEGASVTNTITNNRVHDMTAAGTFGINLLGSGPDTVYNNLVYVTPIGINVASPNAGSVLYNNTLATISGTGIALGSGVTGGLVRNNILFSTGGITNVPTDTQFASNLCSAAGTGCSLVGNPLFVGTGNDPYAISVVTSPAVNAGVTLSPVTVDIIGITRPQPPGGQYDIGAYEFNGPFPPPPGAGLPPSWMQGEFFRR